jgi:hypothetical protein
MLLKWKLFYGNLELVGVWPSGKATGFGPVIQRFESFHPRNRETQKPRNPETQKPRNPETQKSRNPVLLIVMKIEHKWNLSLSEIRRE